MAKATPEFLRDLALIGTPVYPSPYVPEGSVMRIDGRIYFHSRISLRARRRRPHGRTNGPKRWKIKHVRYQPQLDAILAASQAQEGGAS